MLAYTIFVQLQSLVVISTHADRQSVDMSITVCLFVNLSLCTVTNFSAGDKASGIKFCTMVHGLPGHGISHFGELCSSRSPKSDESAPVLKICSFQKRAPYQRGGCPDTLDTHWIRPCSHTKFFTCQHCHNHFRHNSCRFGCCSSHSLWHFHRLLVGFNHTAP